MTGALRRPDWSNRQGIARTLLEAVLALPVRIERVATAQLRLPGAFERITTIVGLEGGGHVGRGEDVAYSPQTQARLPGVFDRLELQGEWTMASLAEQLDEHPLLAGNTGDDDKAGYHRWAVESAALDLALRQHDSDLPGLIGAERAAVRVVLSRGLGSPPSTDELRAWLEHETSIGFKLDTSSAWTHELVAELAELGAVAVVDFKGLYTGEWADNEPDPALYDAVARGLPEVLLEDPNLTAEVRDALDETALQRLSWDAPITSPLDVPGLRESTAAFSDLRPAAINIKPSRFGSLERLLGTIALCDMEGIPCYAGGQYELGVGRTQVQAIASLCFPDAPNDCAPTAFHGARPGDATLPGGRVEVPAGAGFGWEAATPAQPV